MDRHVLNAFVYGDSMRNYVVGVIVPDQRELMAWCKKNGVVAEVRVRWSFEVWFFKRLQRISIFWIVITKFDDLCFV